MSEKFQTCFVHSAYLVCEQCVQERIAALERDLAAALADAERYRWMKREVKRIPPGWEMIGWDAAIDQARGGGNES